MIKIKMIKAQLLLGFFILLGFNGCSRSPNEIDLLGQTMGTTYSIKIVSEENIEEEKIQHDIDSILVSINKQMSTYINDSEINQFNAYQGSAPFQLSPEFYQVVERAFYWTHLSDGAFDIAIMPLSAAWGFGPKRVSSSPSELDIRSALKSSGYEQLILHLSGLQKLNPHVQLDVNAIAKGFGVDVVASYLSRVNISNYMVEIGGEVYCRGVNQKGEIWNIGIQSPNNVNREFLGIVSLNNQAIATSGDYRNFYVSEGKTISHVIDPRSGETVTDVSSASVIADNCMDADALATGLMVMGEEDGMKLVESLNGIEAMMVIRNDDGSYKEVMSTGFKFTSVQE
ncbi:MAG TPA: FAD:protein FMN transferase [Candidatus Marinimicrobia bacterium]|nr:FAD:protein FMN transferase [Candidatus Neomarinimicrobiota bacterium]